MVALLCPLPPLVACGDDNVAPAGRSLPSDRTRDRDGGSSAQAGRSAAGDAGAQPDEFEPIGRYDPESTEEGELGPSCDPTALCREESCCTTLLVPRGTFLMGRSEDGTDACPAGDSVCEAQPDEEPEAEVSVSAFYLDKYEVTVGRFAAFVAAYAGPPADGAGEHPDFPGSGYDRAWDDDEEHRAVPPAAEADFDDLLDCTPPEQSDMPVLDDLQSTWASRAAEARALPLTCIDWRLAFAFCVWDGGRLPTEAEWEYAAAGADQDRLYPWGNDAPDDELASFDRPTGDGPEAVGSHPAGDARWGQTDLAGSLWEWVLAIDRDAGTGEPARRGGAWFSSATDLRATNRGTAQGLPRADAIGFRCARDM